MLSKKVTGPTIQVIEGIEPDEDSGEREDARTDSSKRLVLHSAEDQAAEINSLKQTIASMQTTITSLQADFQALQNAHTSLNGQVNTMTTQTEFGRKNIHSFCLGYTSGKRYDDVGSGVDTFCLPEEPLWGKYSDASNGYRAYIYGSEIHHDASDNEFPYAVHNQDMPCAVCLSERALNLMIPGRTACYPGWTLEYSGYMMTNVQGRESGQDTICVDDHPEFLDHGGSDDSQHILYLVEAQCGSLPCPPYVNNRELPCAVCSK
ncbi:uncharacterized protein LOC128210528 [Mya arenaria]|uniref:uncharacterized protein LOC128210528 n=1 Tax=Mya arenaria TaxID=6604 RepID=UPI0022E60C1D|nr:uncharacterized protein LOC128210528 [Mya arenaria]